MSYTEVTEEGCLQRMMNAIFGVLFGVVLILGSLYGLFWNEGRAVRRAKALEEGKSSVVHIDASRVDRANEGRLVHLTAEATTTDRVTDNLFGVEVTALRLRRTVEMYQWKETVHTRTEKRTGGKKRTIKTYSYSKVWSSSLISSSSFRKSAGHENPGSMPIRPHEDAASKVTVGAFTLGRKLVDMIDSWEVIDRDAIKRLPDGARIEGEYVFSGRGSLGSPQVGDVRVQIEIVKPTMVSLYAKQTGDTFDTYYTSNRQPLMRLQVGSFTAKEMFEAAEQENTMLTWVLRLLGTFLVWLGFVLIFKPFAVAADVIPFFGDLVETGISLAAFALAAPMALFAIAVGWIVYRPLLGILLMAAGLAIFTALFRFAASRKAAKSGGGSAAPPPIPS